MTINREQAVFVKGPFEVQFLDAAVRLIARQPMFLFELRAITAGDDSAHGELNPVLVLFRLIFGSRSGHGFAVACVTGVNSNSCKSSRKNQHEESASGGLHKIQINI